MQTTAIGKNFYAKSDKKQVPEQIALVVIYFTLDKSLFFAGIFYFGQVFVFCRSIIKNVLECFLLKARMLQGLAP